MAAEVSIERYDGRVVVRKVPLPGDQHDREAEARWLARAGARGVVELVTSGPPPVGIVTVHAGSHTWRTTRPDPVRAAALLASAMRTLAELHRRGLVHGAVVADHLVVSGSSVLLCSPDPTASDPAVDRRALAELVAAAQDGWRADGLPLPPGSAWGRAAELLSNPASGWSLDDIAGLLSPTDPPSVRGPRRRRVAGRRTARLAVGRRAAAGLGSVAVLAVAVAAATSPERSQPPVGPDGGGPAVELGGARYRASGAGAVDDVLAATERPCPGSPAAAVLEPATGVVWAFRQLPGETAPEGGEPVQQVPGSSDLDVRNEGSCERLVVTGPAGEAPVPTPQE